MCDFACGEQPRTFYTEDFSFYSLAPCVGGGGIPERVTSVRRIIVQDKNKASIGVASLVAQLLKNPPAMRKTWARSLS